MHVYLVFQQYDDGGYEMIVPPTTNEALAIEDGSNRASQFDYVIDQTADMRERTAKAVEQPYGFLPREVIRYWKHGITDCAVIVEKWEVRP